MIADNIIINFLVINQSWPFDKIHWIMFTFDYANV